MSASVTDRVRRVATVPPPRDAQPTPGRTSPKAGQQKAAPEKKESGSARRAYARRDERLRKLIGGRPGRVAAPAGRAKFVLLLMVLLAAGLVATLWLSTAAAADSYRLQDARKAATTLSQQGERLRQEVTLMESAPELARRADELGMVRVLDPARLVVAPDGSTTVVGEPEAALAPQPPAPPSTAAVPPPATDPAQQQPGAGGAEFDGTVPDGTAAGAPVAPDAGQAGTTPDAATQQPDTAAGGTGTDDAAGTD